jgi:hypothetical protein
MFDTDGWLYLSPFCLQQREWLQFKNMVLEEPTADDSKLWQQALREISTGGRSRLPTPLGRLLGHPHIHNSWTYNES